MLIQDQSIPLRAIRLGTLVVASLAMLSLSSNGNDGPASTFLPTGLSITPTAAPGSTYQALNPKLSDFPNFTASGALSTVKSPDGNTLLVLVSGHNTLRSNGIVKENKEYIFVFDISGGNPVEKQIIKVPNSFVGIVFDPSGTKFYVGAWTFEPNTTPPKADDAVYVYTVNAGTWAQSGSIALGHNGNAIGLFAGDVGPVPAGIDITKDGKTLVVANLENDSISFIDLTNHEIAEEFVDLDNFYCSSDVR
jgi:DNA-binding beta-propeller fold protein YncE